MNLEPSDFQLEPFEPNKYKVLGVFELAEQAWFAGYNLESCIKEAADSYGIFAEEGGCRLLNDDLMKGLTVYDEETGNTDALEDLFAMAKSHAKEFPCLLAILEC